MLITWPRRSSKRWMRWRSLEMKVGIHQPQYLPWLPYLLKITECDLFVLLDSVDFQKNGLQNRNQVKTPQGACWLTVPVRHKLGQSIVDVQIDASSNWQRKHWQTFAINYRKAAAFALYSEELEAAYQTEWKSLVDINLRFLEIIMEGLGINTPLRRSSEMTATGKGSELILNLCGEVNASTYLSGIGAQNYLDEKAFEEAGIHIEYRRPVFPDPYPQQYPGAGFLNDLSAIDLLLNCGCHWDRYVP